MRDRFRAASSTDAAGHINRGVAISGTRLFMETDNAHLVCLDSRSGNLIWDSSLRRLE